MDSLTHIVLGACIGETMLGKKIGKRAMLLGAIAQSVPDIDFLASLWLDPASNLLAHRGFTHSFLFVLVFSPFLALLAERWHRPHNIALAKWYWFFACSMFIHVFLDAFNAYGVGWFEPFSHYRVSFNAIFVADPFFSIGPGIAFVALLFLSQNKKGRMKWVKLGLLLPSLYLVMSVLNKLMVESEIKKLAATQNIQYKRFFSTPAPFNNLLWYFVLETDSGYNVGYRSVYDSKDKFQSNYFPRNEKLLNTTAAGKELDQLLRFSQGYYTVEQWDDTTVLNILRFGQEIGWADPHAHFAFHYYLDHHADNKFVLQRGRFARWDRNAMKLLIQRMRGD